MGNALLRCDIYGKGFPALIAMHISRRTLLKTLFSSAVAGGLAVYTNANAQLTTSARFEIKQLPLKVPHLPSDLNGFRIAFVSDIHLGIFLPLSAIDALTAAIRHEAPDLLLLGGDYLWVHKSWFWRDLGFFSESPFLNLSEAPLRTAIYTELLTRLSTLTPRHGIFGCYGNHEHWEGTKTM
jgi:predicted MPP superfamily phosphohydrolase